MLGVDYAWRHPNPAAIKADGYDIVLRYFSDDATKNLTAAEVSALHAADLEIVAVWEISATDALGGFAAGVAAAHKANAEADAIGYPLNVPIYFAIDSDLAPAQVAQYFAGINSVNKRPTGVYGSFRLVEALIGDGSAHYAWQTMAWSWDAANKRYLVSNKAHFLQRISHTRGPIAGSADGDWDEDVVLAPSPTWGKAVNPSPAPVHPTHHNPPVPTPVGKLVVDGDLGAKTIARLQQALGTPVDGKISTPRSTVVYVLQEVLNAKVHAGLALDGFGLVQDDKPYRTVTALQEYLKQPVHDGRLSLGNSPTVRALQDHLNAINHGAF